MRSITFTDKKIGDTTSVTLPTKYVCQITGKVIEVEEKHLRLINEKLGSRQFVSLVMTGIDLVLSYNQGISIQAAGIENKLGDIDSRIDKMQDQMSAILKAINAGVNH